MFQTIRQEYNQALEDTKKKVRRWFKFHYFEKEKFIKGVDIYAMDKVGNELFVSTNLENVMFDGSNVSFMGKGFPNTKIRDVYIHVDGRAWYVAEDQIIK